MTYTEKAAEIVGGKSELARQLKVTPTYISKMIRENHVPAEQCMKIQRLTKGKVKAKEMRPDIFG